MPLPLGCPQLTSDVPSPCVHLWSHPPRPDSPPAVGRPQENIYFPTVLARIKLPEKVATDHRLLVTKLQEVTTDLHRNTFLQ